MLSPEQITAVAYKALDDKKARDVIEKKLRDNCIIKRFSDSVPSFTG